MYQSQTGPKCTILSQNVKKPDPRRSPKIMGQPPGPQERSCSWAQKSLSTALKENLYYVVSYLFVCAYLFIFLCSVRHSVLQSVLSSGTLVLINLLPGSMLVVDCQATVRRCGRVSRQLKAKALCNHALSLAVRQCLPPGKSLPMPTVCWTQAEIAETQHCTVGLLILRVDE